MIAKTPNPPYYAVIFATRRTEVQEGYAETAERMVELARKQPGFLGIESVHEDIGLTISYWQDLDSIQQWKRHAEHTAAREKGRTTWYREYTLRIAKVEKEYSFSNKQAPA
ncbi:MAG: antibiotic biosynthesis monooxygenase [Saprospiraceae bacterium]|nr:antibiotic biosynthesis monooxygenase [Saprospiraceae bacterium]